MNPKTVVKNAIHDYERITGLRAYVVYDNTVIESASERNYFCKCLKLSSKALKECEACTKETYDSAKEIDEVCIYSCHAGLIKWAVPIHWDDFHCVIVSEGILSGKQMEDAQTWAEYLSKEYTLDEKMLLQNFKVIQTMNEEQMNSSIDLLKNLLDYHREFELAKV